MHTKISFTITLIKIKNYDGGTEYKHVYALRNKDTGNYLLTYWASSQKHKALFSTRKKAEEAVKRIDDNTNIEIVEL